MTPEQREHWRYTFVSQIYGALAASNSDFTFLEARLAAIEQADALLAALEAAEQERCDHKVFIPRGLLGGTPKFSACPKCGLDIAP